VHISKLGFLQTGAQDGIDFRKFVVGEIEPVECFEIFFELCNRARAEKRGSHDGEAQDPGDGQLCDGLPAPLSDFIECLDFREIAADLVGLEEAISRCA
jgi:hypothetical protein